jgi:hypothetical protein
MYAPHHNCLTISKPSHRILQLGEMNIMRKYILCAHERCPRFTHVAQSVETKYSPPLEDLKSFWKCASAHYIVIHRVLVGEEQDEENDKNHEDAKYFENKLTVGR